MNTRTNVALLSSVLLMIPMYGVGQSLSRPPGPFPESCHVTSSATVETSGLVSIEQLVRTSKLIVVGTIVNVLPAVLANSDHPLWPFTDSLVSIREVLHGTAPENKGTITLNQIGGKVGKCEGGISDDPVVKVTEEYVLFLRPDLRTVPPNTSGSPRYASVGIWAGRAKIVDGKIRFNPAAAAALHKYDNTEQTAFIELVKDRVRKFFPKRP